MVVSVGNEGVVVLEARTCHYSETDNLSVVLITLDGLFQRKLVSESISHNGAAWKWDLRGAGGNVYPAHVNEEGKPMVIPFTSG